MGRWDRRNFGRVAHDSVVVNVVDRIQKAARHLGIEGDVVPFGSHTNSLCTSFSDCDVTFVPREARGVVGTDVLWRCREDVIARSDIYIIRYILIEFLIRIIRIGNVLSVFIVHIIYYNYLYCMTFLFLDQLVRQAGGGGFHTPFPFLFPFFPGRYTVQVPRNVP